MKNPRMRAVTATRTATTAYIDVLELMSLSRDCS